MVVDASVLVGEVLRVRGLALLIHPDRTLFQPQHTVSETEHELRRRGALMVRSGRADRETVEQAVETTFAVTERRRPGTKQRPRGRFWLMAFLAC